MPLAAVVSRVVGQAAMAALVSATERAVTEEVESQANRRAKEAHQRQQEARQRQAETQEKFSLWRALMPDFDVIGTMRAAYYARQVFKGPSISANAEEFHQEVDSGKRIVIGTVKAFPEAFAESLITAGIIRGIRVGRVARRRSLRSSGKMRSRESRRTSIATQNAGLEHVVSSGVGLWRSPQGDHAGFGSSLLGAVTAVSLGDLWQSRMKD